MFEISGEDFIDKLVTGLKQSGHRIEILVDAANEGVTSNNITRLMEVPLPADIAGLPQKVSPSVIISVNKFFEIDHNIGVLHTQRLKDIAASVPNILFLLINFCRYEDKPDVEAKTNLWCWNLVDEEEIETFDPNALPNIISALEQNRLLAELNTAKREEAIQRIETKSEVFVKESLDSLEKRQFRNFVFSLVMYAICFVAILVGTKVLYLQKGEFQPTNNFLNVFLITKTIGLVSLMAISVKVASDLGKAFMRESLRNADRIHAINFGRFYLSAYGDQATWPDIKDAFAQWNIDQPNAFADIKGDYDPKILEIAATLAKLNEKKKE